MNSASNPPSIRQVISSLRNAFRKEEFTQAETELLSREANLRREKEEIELNLREKCDILEGQYTDMRLQVAALEGERDRLRRECKINDVKLADLATDLKVARSGEERANRRYGESLKEQEVLLDELHRQQSEYTENLASLTNEVDDLRRKLREKEEKIKGLMMKNDQLLEIAKREEEAVAQLEHLRRRNEHLEERSAADISIEEMKKQVSKLEMCVSTWMLTVPRDKNLAHTQVGKILTKFIEFLGSQTKEDGNFLDADLGVASLTDEPAEVARALIFEPEVSVETGAKKALPPVINIIDIDSGSDDEILHHQELKRKLSKRDDNEVSSDGSLNPKHRMKKLNDLTHEHVKRELINPPRQTVSAVRKCNEENSRSAKSNTVLSPKVKELLNTCQRMTGKNMVLK